MLSLRYLYRLVIGSVALLASVSSAWATEILITIDHVDNHEAAVFRSFSRNGANQGYQNVLAAKRRMQSIIDDYGLVDLNKGWQIKSLAIYCGVMQLPKGVNEAELIASLRADRRVESVQRMEYYSVQQAVEATVSASLVAAGVNETLYDDAYFLKQYGQRAEAIARLHRSSTGKGVKVAVIDTGADVDHEELRNNIWRTNNLVDQNERRFNADIHEAITQIPAPTDDLKGKIVDVVEKGYKLGEKIIRFPKVVIGQ